jgi:plastocyanin
MEMSMSMSRALLAERRRKRASRRGLWLALSGALAVAVVGLPSSVLAEDAKPATVTIDNFSFTPAVLEIHVGTTVTWTNRDDIPHTVAEKSIAWRSKPMDTDDSFTHTFDTAGEFAYFCTLHPHMTGKIVVKP